MSVLPIRSKILTVRFGSYRLRNDFRKLVNDDNNSDFKSVCTNEMAVEGRGDNDRKGSCMG